MEITDEQKEQFRNIILAAMAKNGWNQKQAAQYCDVPATVFMSLTRTYPAGINFTTLCKVLLGLDIPLYYVVEVLGLDETVKEHLREFGGAMFYPNHARILQRKDDSLEALLRTIKPEFRKIARVLIETVLTQMK